MFFFSPHNGPLLATFAPDSLQDFPVQGNETLSSRQQEEACYRSFRQKCTVKEKYCR